MTFIKGNSFRQTPGVLLVFVLFSMFVISACTTSPATGEKVISFNTLAEEKRIGLREHPKIVKQFGGIYKNPKVRHYVTSLGKKLSMVSELPGIGWTFTVLNSGEINAFAIPGGFIYVTRGLVALANNEAELAGVISHEIGHVAALHSSSRQATGKLAGLGALAAGILFGRAGSELGSFVGQASVQRYSQSQEFEADSLGVRYLSRAGYDTRAMASFLDKMWSFSKLENKKLGRPENAVDQQSILASHPRTLERVSSAIQKASSLSSGNKLGRIGYMKMLHGVVYGDDLEQGIIRGREFIHPVLKFRFTVPKGFRLTNSPNTVVARNLDGAVIQFDMDMKQNNSTMTHYLRNIWASNVSLKSIERIMVNGMEGVTAASEIRRANGFFDLRFVAVRKNSQNIFRMLFLTPRQKRSQLSSRLRRTTYSLRTIGDQEAKSIRPLRISVKAVSAGNTVRSFVSKMVLADFREETFRVLNGLSSMEELRTGQLVKIVTN